MLRVALWSWLLVTLLIPSVSAEEIAVRHVQLMAAENNGYSLSADFDLELSERLETALAKGVPLYFSIEFQCTRSRWYWLDALVAEKKIETRLSFHALTRSYRLSAGTLHQSFSTVEEALRALGTVRGWQVLSSSDLEPRSTYEVGVRMWLDVNQLPKPFQVSALTNREWVLASPWERWGFSTGADGRIVQ